MKIIKHSIIPSLLLILVAILLTACETPVIQANSIQQTSLLEPQAG